jgi:hypothetical protein
MGKAHGGGRTGAHLHTANGAIQSFLAAEKQRSFRSQAGMGHKLSVGPAKLLGPSVETLTHKIRIKEEHF